MNPCKPCWKKEHCNKKMRASCSLLGLFEVEMWEKSHEIKLNFINGLQSLFLTESSPLYKHRTAKKEALTC